MVTIPAELKYTQQHEWVRVEDAVAVIGITDFAQEQLGDIVYIELPEIGAQLRQSQALGVIESVKAATDVYAPTSGTVTEVNESLRDRPELVNQYPYDAGWIVKATVGDEKELEGLLSSTEYEALVVSTS